MKLPRIRPALVLLFSILVVAPAALVTPASAQYMYLDSNGDGIHTAADQVNPVGTTVVDLWLDTDSNRDGSPAVCPDASYPLSMISYTFAIRATGGTIAWSDFRNALPSFGVHFLALKSDTDFQDGYGGYPALPPGLYRLGQFEATVLSGTPSVEIIPSAPGPLINQGTGLPFPAETAFGSNCLGVEFDNTMRLGADWSGVDGLPFGTGGTANGAPVLTQPLDMSVAVGETATQTLTATDADRQPVTFSKFAGPDFVTVATTDAGNGTATGKVFVRPRLGDVGTVTVIVQATGGTAYDQKSLLVTVTPSPNHPPVLLSPSVADVVAGTVRRIRLEALDPDGQTLMFTKVSGPDYVNVSTLTSGSGAAAGSIRLAPVQCDVGISNAMVATSDGVSTTSMGLQILVRSATPAISSPPPVPFTSLVIAIAVADLNSDHHLDVVTGDGAAQAGISIFLGKGDGTLGPRWSTGIAGYEPTSIAIGDFNRDARPDLAVTTFVGGNLQVLLGRGDGTFGGASELGPLSNPFYVGTADFDGDGALDLIASNGAGGGATLFLGVGDGTFGPGRDVDLGGPQRWLTIADFNRDGIPDLASANFLNSTVGIRLGLGDGSFRDHTDIPFGGAPYAIIAEDLNWDGAIDLSVTDYQKGRVVAFLGDGEGGFTAGAEFGGFNNPQSLASSDFNGDGNIDLLIGDPSDAVDENKGSARISPGLGNGAFDLPRQVAMGAAWGVAAGDMNEDGFPDAIVASDGLHVWLNDAAGAGAADARAFSRIDSHRRFPFFAALAPECIRLEPVRGSYQNSDVNFGSITLSSEGTGSVSEIPAMVEHRAIQLDFDRNGVAEIPVCFERRDLGRLFDKLHGSQVVTAHVQGSLNDGRRFCTSVDLDIAGARRRFVVFLTPNPLNPQATLSYSTTADGYVRIRVFDLSGRLVRTLVDQPQVAAGDHAVVIDGRNQSGARLASGMRLAQWAHQEIEPKRRREAQPADEVPRKWPGVVPSHHRSVIVAQQGRYDVVHDEGDRPEPGDRQAHDPDPFAGLLKKFGRKGPPPTARRRAGCGGRHHRPSLSHGHHSTSPRGASRATPPRP